MYGYKRHRFEKTSKPLIYKRVQLLDSIGIDLQLGTGNQELMAKYVTGQVDAFNNINNGYRSADNGRVSAFDIVGLKKWVKMAHYEIQLVVEKSAVAEEELATFVITI